ncbi:MAG: hypothetical protein ACI9YH_004466 [Colwellia sp.]|jgi:uncharacterized protein (TIGR02922 family)
MTDYQEKLVTVIYYRDTSLELLHKIQSFLQCPKGRVVIPETFRRGKSIIAVCEGEINIMNKIGDRILGVDQVA